MKTFSLASVTAALIFTSSPAMADCHQGYSYVRGGYYYRSGIVVRAPGIEILPRVLLPSPAMVYSPRAPVVAHRPAVVNVRPAPTLSPVVVAAPEPEHTHSGHGKPSKPDGNGNGGKRPQKPSR